MSRERIINYKDSNVELLKTKFHVYMLDKIQDAIEKVKMDIVEGGFDNQVNVSFAFNELQLLRRLLIIDDLQIEFCRDNMLEGMELNKKRNEKLKSNLDEVK